MPVAAWIALAGVFVTLTLHGAVFAYFLGRLTQRVEGLEKASSSDASVAAKVIRLEVEMIHANEKLDGMARELAGVHRQLANLATNKAFKPMLEG